MSNKPILRVERYKFEEFWRSTMNVQDMDLHRCEFPMTAYDDQPYACHETGRGWETWMARAGLDQVTNSAPLDTPINVRSYGAVGDGITDDSCAFQAALCAQHQHQPVTVVMPERCNERDHAGDFTYEATGWNACLDEVAKLNGLKP